VGGWRFGLSKTAFQAVFGLFFDFVVLGAGLRVFGGGGAEFCGF
jgi:hypothetical protein